MSPTSIYSLCLECFFALMCNYLIGYQMFRLSGVKLRFFSCLIFSIILTLVIFLPIAIYSIVFAVAKPSVIFARIFYFFNYFRNPLWVIACHFCALKILKISQSNIINLLLPFFCFSQFYVLLSGLLEPAAVAFASGDTDIILIVYTLWQLTTFLIVILLLCGFNIYIKRNTNRFRVNLKNEKKTQKKLLVQNYILMLIIWLCLSVLINLCFQYTTAKDSMPALIALTLFMTLIMLFSIKAIFQKTAAENSQAHLEALISSVDEFKKTKHEFYNILQMYEGFIKLKNYDGLEAFHENLFSQTVASVSGLDISKLSSRPALYGLILNISEEAKQNNVKLLFHQVEGLAHIDMPEYDLCRILSILLHNAVEHSALSYEKTVSVLVKVLAESEGIVIIGNSIDNPADLSKIFVKGYSTKQGHQGRGLYDARNILSAYPKFSITADGNSKTFSTYFKVLFK